MNRFDSTFFLNPLQTLRELEKTQRCRLFMPWKSWIGLFAIAVTGSFIYGASLSLNVPTFDLVRGGLWLTLSAGIAWAIFIPCLVMLSGRHPVPIAHACLVTMACGEVVLLAGAAANLGLRLGSVGIEPVALNWSIVCIANAAMACALAVQLRILDFPAWKTIACWMLLLNGSGALLFRYFYHQFGGRA